MPLFEFGIYKYTDPLPSDELNNLPDFLHLSNASHETVLLRLLLGHLNFSCCNGKKHTRRRNFFSLPYKYAPAPTCKSICKSINKMMSNSACVFMLNSDATQLKNYLNLNRKNIHVFQVVLFELSSYLISQPTSPTKAFAHLYRCLEYLSFTFPLIFAAKSKDYKGTYANLQKFLSGDSSGELKFFRTFLHTLFCDESTTLNYLFEMNISIKLSLSALKKDFNRVYNGLEYEFDTTELKIKFDNLLPFFITTRNRYFHMLVGQGHENFSPIDYDIDEYFRCINPHLLNWLSIIIQKITVFSFYAR